MIMMMTMMMTSTNGVGKIVIDHVVVPGPSCPKCYPPRGRGVLSCTRDPDLTFTPEVTENCEDVVAARARGIC